MIKIVAVGKNHETWIAEGVATFSKRLRAPWNLEWCLLPHSSKNGLEARLSESEAILSMLKSDDYVVLLDERGKMFDSPALSTQLQNLIDSSRHIVFVIGGAYGVDEKVRSRADLIWSLSDLVFPHQLVRLILAEQIYRAQQIAAGHPYHHS